MLGDVAASLETLSTVRVMVPAMIAAARRMANKRTNKGKVAAISVIVLKEVETLLNK